MRFRAGDDLLARVRALRLRRPRHRAERRQPPEPPRTQITYYGRHGEMGHAEDRADSGWGPCGTAPD